MTRIHNSLSPKAQSWCVVLSAALFFFYILMQINLFNAVSSELTTELNLTSSQLGYLASVFFYGNLLFLFPAGLLLDRFSVRNLLLVAFFITLVSSYVFSTTSSFVVMNITRFIIGLMGSLCFLPSIKLASRWFKPQQMALAIGIVTTMGMLGGMLAQTPLVLLVQKIGWRAAIQAITNFGVLLIFIQLIFIKDEPKKLEKIDALEQKHVEKIGFWHCLTKTLANTQNWYASIYICLVNLPIYILGIAWGVPYLTQMHNLTQIQASHATAMIFIGMMLGCPLAGAISDRIGLRKPPMLFGAILTLIAVLIIMFTPTLPAWIMIGEFLFLGLASGWQVIGYPVLAESNPHEITGVSTSLGSILIVSGGTLIPVFGYLLNFTGNTVYTATDFTRAHGMMIAGLLVAIIVAWLIKETHCRNIHS